MLVVQEITFSAGDEELAAICVFSAVGHRQQAGRIVFKNEIFVRECATIDAVHTGAVTLSSKSEDIDLF